MSYNLSDIENIGTFLDGVLRQYAFGVGNKMLRTIIVNRAIKNPQLEYGKYILLMCLYKIQCPNF